MRISKKILRHKILKTKLEVLIAMLKRRVLPLLVLPDSNNNDAHFLPCEKVTGQSIPMRFRIVYERSQSNDDKVDAKTDSN